jgi:hypothetical protein
VQATRAIDGDVWIVWRHQEFAAQLPPVVLHEFPEEFSVDVVF